jgi:magnesium-transporting ATPase (P-type)
MDEVQKAAYKLVLVQVVGIVMLLVGWGSLASTKNCKNCTNHDRDRGLLLGSLIAVVLISLICMFHFDIFTIFSLSTADQTHLDLYESQIFAFLQSLAWTDLFFLFVVVTCSGGLVNSFYSPVFILIPSAALVLQEVTYNQFNTRLFLASLSAISIAALVNWRRWDDWLCDKFALNPTNKHSTYNFCLWAVTMLGAGVSFVDFIWRTKK